MAITRRIFAKTLAAAPLAGAALGQSGSAALASSGMSSPGLLSGGGYALGQSANVAGARIDTGSMLKSAMAELAGLEGRRQEAYQNALHYISRLDADLAENRSMSMATKIRLQAERTADRTLANERSWMMRRIDKLKKGEL